MGRPPKPAQVTRCSCSKPVLFLPVHGLQPLPFTCNSQHLQRCGV